MTAAVRVTAHAGESLDSLVWRTIGAGAGVVEAVLEAKPQAQIVDEAPSGRLHVDGKLIVPAVEGPAKFRRKLSFVGIVVASLAIDRKGSLVSDIGIVADGLPAGFEDRLRTAAEEAFSSMPRPRRQARSVCGRGPHGGRPGPRRRVGGPGAQL